MAEVAKYPAVRDLFSRTIGNPPTRGTLKDIADSVGVEPPTVTRWRKGEARPGSEFWDGLAECLGVTAAEVRIACGGLSEKETVNELLQAVEGLSRELAHLRRRMDDRGL